MEICKPQFRTGAIEGREIASEYDEFLCTRGLRRSQGPETDIDMVFMELFIGGLIERLPIVQPKRVDDRVLSRQGELNSSSVIVEISPCVTFTSAIESHSLPARPRARIVTECPLRRASFTAWDPRSPLPPITRIFMAFPFQAS